MTLDFPVIDNDELAKIQHIDTALPGRTSVTIRGLYRVEAGHKGMQKRLAQMCQEVDQAIEDGAEFIVLSATATRTRTSRRSRRCSCSRPCTTTSSATRRA